MQFRFYFRFQVDPSYRKLNFLRFTHAYQPQFSYHWIVVIGDYNACASIGMIPKHERRISRNGTSLTKNNLETRSIQRTQTPPRLCHYMSLIVLYLGTRYDVYECNSLRDMTISSFFVTFDLHRPSRLLSFSLLDWRYIVVYWFQVRSL